jgi:hypothetical protein
VNVPMSVAAISNGQPAITATGYDAAGHVVGQVTLGHMA